MQCFCVLSTGNKNCGRKCQKSIIFDTRALECTHFLLILHCNLELLWSYHSLYCVIFQLSKIDIHFEFDIPFSSTSLNRSEFFERVSAILYLCSCPPVELFE